MKRQAERPGAGWFPDPARRRPWRWWNGHEWTLHTWDGDHRLDPIVSRARSGVLPVCIIVAGTATLLAGLPFLGDPGIPDDRSGLRRTGDGIELVTAICPGERLRTLSVGMDDAGGRRTIVWRITGDAPMPENLMLGGPIPAGLVSTESAPQPWPTGATVTVLFDTTALPRGGVVRAEVGHLEQGHIVVGDDVFVADKVFRKTMLRNASCDDPYHERIAWPWVLGCLAVGLAALVGAVATRPSRRYAPPTADRSSAPAGIGRRGLTFVVPWSRSRSRPSAGWFADPTGRHRYRWWDGGDWTDHAWDTGPVPDPLVSSRRRAAAIVAILAGGLLVPYSLLLALSEAGGTSRSGLRRNSDGSIVLLSAVCPGERIEEMEVFIVDAQRFFTSVWKVDGDAALPSELTLGGDVPSGLAVARRAPDPWPTGNVYVSLGSSRLPLDSMEASTSALLSGKIVSGFGTFTDEATFREQMLRRLPCDDPHGADARIRRARIALTLSPILGIAGIVVWPRRRRYRAPRP